MNQTIQNQPAQIIAPTLNQPIQQQVAQAGIGGIPLPITTVPAPQPIAAPVQPPVYQQPIQPVQQQPVYAPAPPVQYQQPQQPVQTQQQSPFQEETLCYLGKVIGKQGVIGKGPKTGQQYTIWKLTFRKGQYGFKCSAFDGSLSTKNEGIQVAQMVENQFYKIVYKMNDFIGAHGPGKSRQAVIVAPSESQYSTEGTGQYQAPQQPQPQQYQQPLQQAPPPTEVKKTAQDWVKFAQEYLTAMADNPNKNAMHMLGAYVANKHTQEFADIIALCQSNFK